MFNPVNNCFYFRNRGICGLLKEQASARTSYPSSTTEFTPRF